MFDNDPSGTPMARSMGVTAPRVRGAFLPPIQAEMVDWL